MTASIYAGRGGGENSHHGQSFAAATIQAAQRRNSQTKVMQIMGPRNRLVVVNSLVIFVLFMAVMECRPTKKVSDGDEPTLTLQLALS